MKWRCTDNVDRILVALAILSGVVCAVYIVSSKEASNSGGESKYLTRESVAAYQQCLEYDVFVGINDFRTLHEDSDDGILEACAQLLSAVGVRTRTKQVSANELQNKYEAVLAVDDSGNCALLKLTKLTSQCSLSSSTGGI